jgi:hypothetical protein
MLLPAIAAGLLRRRLLESPAFALYYVFPNVSFHLTIFEWRAPGRHSFRQFVNYSTNDNVVLLSPLCRCLLLTKPRAPLDVASAVSETASEHKNRGSCSRMNLQPQSGRMLHRKLVSLVGILLLVALGLIQAVHAHPQSGHSEHSHCALCLVAHATPAVVAPVTAPSIAFIPIHLVLFEPPLRSSNMLSPFCSRPPPAIA